MKTSSYVRYPNSAVRAVAYPTSVRTKLPVEYPKTDSVVVIIVVIVIIIIIIIIVITVITVVVISVISVVSPL